MGPAGREIIDNMREKQWQRLEGARGKRW